MLTFSAGNARLSIFAIAARLFVFLSSRYTLRLPVPEKVFVLSESETLALIVSLYVTLLSMETSMSASILTIVIFVPELAAPV